MKKLALITLSALVFIACQSDLEKKKEELKKAKTQQSEINTAIKDLEKEIAKLDTTKAKVKYTPVAVRNLEAKTFKHFVDVHGIVEASKNILASPEASGRITSFKVKEGQKVSKNQILATIDSDIIRKNIQEV